MPIFQSTFLKPLPLIFHIFFHLSFLMIHLSFELFMISIFLVVKRINFVLVELFKIIDLSVFSLGLFLIVLSLLLIEPLLEEKFLGYLTYFIFPLPMVTPPRDNLILQLPNPIVLLVNLFQQLLLLSLKINDCKLMIV